MDNEQIARLRDTAQRMTTAQLGEGWTVEAGVAQPVFGGWVWLLLRNAEIDFCYRRRINPQFVADIIRVDKLEEGLKGLIPTLENIEEMRRNPVKVRIVCDDELEDEEDDDGETET